MGNREFYPELIERYLKMLQDADYFAVDEFDNTAHLVWMLRELQTNDGQSLTKKHRWLGYIQHALISQGLTSVTIERDFTRNIFNGD